MTLARKLCGVSFVAAGTLHFLRPRDYEAVMPPSLPAHRELVLASGVAEVVGGLAVLTPGLERPARWWLLGLLAAVFPANVNIAWRREEIGLERIPSWALWLRLPFQAALMAWVVWATDTDR